MKIKLKRLLILNLMMVSILASASEHPELKAFPPAKEGMERFVITLPHKERGEDDAFMVEIIAGKEMLTDGVNLLRLGNIIEPRQLKGWGYTYYEVTGSSLTMSTLMAPPEGSPQVKKFVTAVPIKLQYNSRLPIVIYVPTGYEIRYRIWEASQTTHEAEKG